MKEKKKVKDLFRFLFLLVLSNAATKVAKKNKEGRKAFFSHHWESV